MSLLKGLNVTQIALVVDDVDKYLAAYAKVFGIEPPPHIVTDGQDKTGASYRGNKTEARAKLGFIHLPNITIELIEPIGEPSVWKDHLDRHGPSVHHIAFDVADKTAVTDDLGMDLVQQGDFTGGSYAYLDAFSKIGVDIELLQMDS